MKKILLLTVVSIILLLAFSSCDSKSGDQVEASDGTPKEEVSCEHTYRDTWSTSSTSHWHAATCEHLELKADIADHLDTDQDGKCDVCEYELGHEHTYGVLWTSNDTHHWKIATCLHSEEKGELDAHADLDKDGVCDICDAHVHVINLYGNCSVCGDKVVEIDITEIENILPIVLSNADSVVSGNINYNVYSTSAVDNSYTNSFHDIDYILGNSAAYYKVSTSAVGTGTDKDGKDYFQEGSDTQESWYEIYGDNRVFGVFRTTQGDYVGQLSMDGSASLSKLNGYYYTVSTLASAYGAENLLKELYSLSQLPSASDYVYNYNNGEYFFSFNYLYVNTDTAEGDGNYVDYYEVEVSFTVSENGVLNGLQVTCDCYSNSSSNELEQDYIYDESTNTITMKPGAVADVYEFTVTQTEGKRTYVSEHPRSEFIPTDFKIYSDDARTIEIDSGFAVNANEVFTIYVGGFIPEGTSISFISDKFGISCDSENVICFSNAITGTLTIKIKTAGTYTFTVTADEIVKEFSITANRKQSASTTAPANSLRVFVENINEWTTPVSFSTQVSGYYTFHIPAGLGATDDSVDTPYVDPFDPKRPGDVDGGSFTVLIKTGETYVFYVNSASKKYYTIEYDYVAYIGGDSSDTGNTTPVETPLGIGNDNKNAISQKDVTYVFTAETDGTLTLITEACIMGDVTISYSVNGGELVDVPLSSTVAIELSASDKVVITVVAKGYSAFAALWA